jgi:hypothetical protein
VETPPRGTGLHPETLNVVFTEDPTTEIPPVLHKPKRRVPVKVYFKGSQRRSPLKPHNPSDKV